MATLNTIKNWFRTGLKPTQAQFWATWDSFWHKDEAIPQSSITNLAETLNAKAEKAQLTGHINDAQAHPEKVEKASFKEIEIATGVNIDDLDHQGSAFLIIKNPIEITGIKHGTYDGQPLTVKNGSESTVTLKHLNDGSAQGNRLYMTAENDIWLPESGLVVFRYSEVRSRWEMINLHAAALLPGLAYDGAQQRVVTITPEGVLYAEPIMDIIPVKQFDFFDNINVAYATINELVTIGNYSQANGFTKGTRVICGIAQPPVMYYKYDNTDTSWFKIVGQNVPIS